MHPKAIPKPLQLSPRKLRKSHINRNGSSSGTSNLSFEDTSTFGDIDTQSTWEILPQTPMSIGGSPSYQEFSAAPSPPRSSTKIKRWLFRRKNADAPGGAASPNSGLNTPSTAPPDLEPGFSACRSRSVPDLVIEPPQLTLEELAKIDAFYAPTPVLPPTPAPRTGKVYPPWSPDIDYRFKPARSASLGAGNISVRTADIDRGIPRTEGLRRLKAGGFDLANQAGENIGSLRDTPSSSRSDITFESQTRTRPRRRRSVGAETRRHQWVYSKNDETFSNIEDEAVNVGVEFEDNRCSTATSDDSNSKTPIDPFSRNDGLYFTMGESPVANTGEVTLRFVKDPFERPASAPEIDALPSAPSSPSDLL